MTMWFEQGWMRMGLWSALAAASLCAAAQAHAQASLAFPADASHPGKDRTLVERLPQKPSLPPSFSIPVDVLGFSPPGPIYLGQRCSLASLDFLDENRLLFTFRVPGLMHREPGADREITERQIRAVVVVVDTGRVESEALWTVHDRSRYLWMLNDGHFLLRDRDGLEQGDASLELKPALKFPGPLLSVQLDPTQKLMVTNSREPVDKVQKRGDVASPATAAADIRVDGENEGGQPEFVVRILRRESGEVMLVSRARSYVYLPMNAEGYLEPLRGNGAQWMLNMKYFSGGARMLGHVDSTCAPSLNFLGAKEFLVTGCTPAGSSKLLAMTTEGRRLWEDQTVGQAVWPLLVVSPDGSRLIRETLAANHQVNAYAPLDREDIKGQLVRVINTTNGEVALEAAASPPLDAGGNVAISPGGKRVAVLNGGTIQVFDLPPPPPLPDAKADLTKQ